MLNEKQSKKVDPAHDLASVYLLPAYAMVEVEDEVELAPVLGFVVAESGLFVSGLPSTSSPSALEGESVGDGLGDEVVLLAADAVWLPVTYDWRGQRALDEGNGGTH